MEKYKLSHEIYSIVEEKGIQAHIIEDNIIVYPNYQLSCEYLIITYTDPLMFLVKRININKVFKFNSLDKVKAFFNTLILQ